MDETELRNSLTASHSASFGWATVCCRGDRELAEDVLQSVYVALLRGRSKFAGRSSFRTWLFAVIRNVARHERRGRWWSRAVRLDYEAMSRVVDKSSLSEPSIDADDEIAAIRIALGKLPERQREVTHLVFYEGLSIADSAHVMNVSIGTARQHYARAKDALKSHLAHLDITEKRVR